MRPATIFATWLVLATTPPPEAVAQAPLLPPHQKVEDIQIGLHQEVPPPRRAKGPIVLGAVLGGIIGASVGLDVASAPRRRCDDCVGGAQLLLGFTGSAIGAAVGATVIGGADPANAFVGAAAGTLLGGVGAVVGAASGSAAFAGLAFITIQTAVTVAIASKNR